METTKRYRLPYPSDSDQLRELPDIIRKQAEGIDEALAGFDYDGTDPNKLTARMAAVEKQLDAIRATPWCCTTTTTHPSQVPSRYRKARRTSSD